MPRPDSVVLVGGDKSNLPLDDFAMKTDIPALSSNAVASHDYAAAAADWTLTAAEAAKGILVATNASGAVNVVAPATVGMTFIVRNTSGQALTIKKSGGTGVTIASTKTAIVSYIGTDYVRVTADA